MLSDPTGPAHGRGARRARRLLGRRRPRTAVQCQPWDRRYPDSDRQFRIGLRVSCARSSPTSLRPRGAPGALPVRPESRSWLELQSQARAEGKGEVPDARDDSPSSTSSAVSMGVMMALGHSNYYFNSAWLSLDPHRPILRSTRRSSCCATWVTCVLPGFLMMNGAMVHYVFWRRLSPTAKAWAAVRWGFIQRGLFLVAVQVVWVNASWGGFQPPAIGPHGHHRHYRHFR